MKKSEKEVKAGKKGDEKLHKMAVKRHKKDKVVKVMDKKVIKKPQAVVIALGESKKVGKKKKK